MYLQRDRAALEYLQSWWSDRYKINSKYLFGHLQISALRQMTNGYRGFHDFLSERRDPLARFAPPQWVILSVIDHRLQRFDKLASRILHFHYHPFAV